MSIHLLLILHKNHKTAKFFKLKRIILDTNKKHPTQTFEEIVVQISPIKKAYKARTTNQKLLKKNVIRQCSQVSIPIHFLQIVLWVVNEA